MSNSPLHLLKTLLGQSKNNRLGSIVRVTPEILHIRCGKDVIEVPYRTGYRKGQRVILNKSNTLVGLAPSSNEVKVYVA